ncbi:ParA family protein [Haploplasma axanthum]|uniref:ParA/Soj family protein n=1 Tax=Haploplasma axanthum TaxID=29552 RepID=A0A449BBV5_HAPAX|nr:ParA family protein [Haploplasma axanthum]VEU79931.1 ParA/Soj family protein [Haploplasma axanthum]
MLITYFCKKGGVGKTTILGEHADYLASLGKKVLIVSIDDQNSIFEMFGKSSEVFNREDNYIEHLLTESISIDEALIEMRPNIDGIKTLNIDMLSKKLTLERAFEKQFVNLIEEFKSRYDYVFVDLPPSSNRTSEIILELCNHIILIVELNKLGVNGFYNTLQYFVDSGIELDKIRYVLPNGFSKMKSVPSVALEEIVTITKDNLQNAIVLKPIPEKSNIQTLQQKGIVIFDEDVTSLNYYQKNQKKLLIEVFTELFKSIKL